MIERIKLIMQLNWSKTLYINFKMFPFNQALKFPILIWGRCRLNLKGGKIVFGTPLKKGILKIGYQYETFSYKEPTELKLHGTLIITGEVWFGCATHVLVENNALLSIGKSSTIGSYSSLTCTKNIVISDYARIGSFFEITDSNYHFIKHLADNSIYPIQQSVHVGKQNYIGSRVAILPGTTTPDNTIIGYRSVCNKDYNSIVPQNSVIAGVPAKLVKENVVCICDFEKEAKIAQYFKQTGSEIYYDNNQE